MLFQFQRISREEVLELFIPFSRLQRQRIRRKEVSVETNIERATTKTKNRAQKFVFIFLFLFIYPNIQRPKKKVQKKETNIDVK
jgi:hypothetical protein